MIAFWYWMIALALAMILMMWWASNISQWWDEWAVRGYSILHHDVATFKIGILAVGILCGAAGWPLGIWVLLGFYLGLKKKKRAAVRAAAAAEVDRLKKAVDQELVRMRKEGIL